MDPSTNPELEPNEHSDQNHVNSSYRSLLRKTAAGAPTNNSSEITGNMDSTDSDTDNLIANLYTNSAEENIKKEISELQREDIDNMETDIDETFQEQAATPRTRTRSKTKTKSKSRTKKPKLKPGPKSSKEKRARVEDRRHTVYISLGSYKSVRVSIEISGVDGSFGTSRGEVVFSVPVVATRSKIRQWTLTQILREIERSCTPDKPVSDDVYSPLLLEVDDEDPGTSDSDHVTVPTKHKSSRSVEKRSQRSNRYSCAQCSTDFKRKSDLTVHQRNNLCPAVSGPFLCEECGVTTSSHQELKKHRKTHNRTLCHLCGKTFPVGHCYKQHLITHSGVKPFPCSFCSASFRSKTAKSLHETTHGDERPHICQICGASFKRYGLLKRHITYVHNQENKSIKCKTCGRGFRSRSDLNAHMPSHTGEKNFCCQECGKRFAYRVCLQDHQKTVHSDIRAYKCTECDKAFKTSSMLASHRKSHGPKNCTKTPDYPTEYPAKPPAPDSSSSMRPIGHSTTNTSDMVPRMLGTETMDQDFITPRAGGGTVAPPEMEYYNRYVPQSMDYHSHAGMTHHNSVTATGHSATVFSSLRYLDLTSGGKAGIHHPGT